MTTFMRHRYVIQGYFDQQLVQNALYLQYQRQHLLRQSSLIRLLEQLLITYLMVTDLDLTSALDIQGHRGARSVRPENTLAAFQYALEIGVDTLEFDMGVSRDGVVTVLHDQQINPVICQYKDGREVPEGLLVHQLDLTQLKEFDCGSRPNPRFENQCTAPGSEIPTLAEVFELVKNSDLANAKTVLFNIETKSDPKTPSAQPKPEDFVKAVIEVVREYGLENRVTLQSFDHRTLVAAKEIAPELRLAALFENRPDNWVEAADAAEADIVSPHFKLIQAIDVQSMHEAGLAVIPWTANSKRQWERLIKMGVDGIITDDPEPLLKLIGR